MTKELKTIPGYEDYSIASNGDIYRITRRSRKMYYIYRNPRRRIPIRDHNGYWIVVLWKDGKGKKFFVHRLVLLTFKGEPRIGQEASHLDGNRSNNSIENLAWETRRENNSRKLIHGTLLCGEKSLKCKLNSTDVFEIRELIENRESFQREIADRYGVSRSEISKIKCGKSWKHTK
jgi:hypothetical protein